MKRESLAEFLESMKEVNLYNWDALVVYDRNKTNLLLMQEYIDRFDQEQYFEPLSFVTEITPGMRWEKTFDQVLDAPRLSFENASITYSRADLAMRIVGGKQISISQQQGATYKQVTRLKLADALNGSVLHARVNLDVAGGGVNSAGQVVLDLKKVDEFYLKFADTDEENRIGGARFKDIFDNWPDAKKVFELNRLVVNKDEVVQPKKFSIRTHAAPDSQVLNGPNQGGGAVVLFVTMEGGSEGSFPPDDAAFHYLLPDGEDGPFSANIVLGNQYVLQPLMKDALAKFGETITVRPLLEGNKVIGVEAKTGKRFVEGKFHRDQELFKATSSPGYLPVQPYNNAPGFSMIADGTRLKCRWRGEVLGWFVYQIKTYPEYIGAIVAVFDCEFYYVPSVAVGSDGERRVVFEFLEGKPVEVTATMLTTDEPPPNYGETLYPDFERLYADYIKELIESAIQELSPAYDAINAFKLNGLLFRGGNETVEPAGAYMPLDLTLPGYLAPTRTKFQIDKSEVIVAAGQQHTFSIVPAGADVQWSVANLPGETGAAGSITAAGVYTAPAVTELPLKHKRVIVTAKSKNSDHFSKAMVGVVTRSIGIDPLVMAVSTGGSRSKVTATALGNQTITWQMSKDSKGQIIDDPDADPDVQYAKIYVSPPASASTLQVGEGRNVALAARKSDAWLARQEDDEIEEVLWVDQIEAKLAGGVTEKVDVLVPLEPQTNWFTFEARGTGVQLKFWAKSKKGEYEVEPDNTTWYLVAGSGTFVNGLYTPPAVGAEDYAVVAAIEYDNRSWYWAYAILPVPFVTADTFVQLFED
ncbi:hypothetical protein [Pseudomonas sp. BP8]|uniref:hypothetical protein n=1 Tax=Pseudomonas sp. BP8 TaxID=2817864 RepID=UPI001AE454ED|nr:hypothetical protein [Pseudomonas sp. BP8]MBP2263581.1 hypothetical protein [Pseudomonas sp. BP8]HDS1735572.1 hypothetical protein [Pseudomonas putida]